MKEKRGLKKNITMFAMLLFIVAEILFLLYFHTYYKADESVSLESTKTVTISQENGGYYFDGPGTDDLIIFYPGAKVDAKAYAPLMEQLAEKGMDCFIVEMPFRFALIDEKAADRVMDAYDYTQYYLAGHSLGGAVAAIYASKNIEDERIYGLILLAAYTSKPLSEADYPIAVIYGSEDQVLSSKALQRGREYVNSQYKEFVIEGGNHAQFGNYGVQKGDGTAILSSKEQQEQTVEIIENIVQSKNEE